ncbi:MAG: hypothetical protein H6618_09875 [Deltaproteobacteria bacterium]|nr:hypothetical protein [Deltaproteobacteria bacterium]
MEHPVSDLRLATGGRYLAFREHHPVRGYLLKYLDLRTRKIFLVTTLHTGSSFLWAPYGYRLLYRTQEQIPGKDEVISRLSVRDAVLRKNIEIRMIRGRTGLISIDPYDYRVWLMGESQLYRQQLSYPGSRLAQWQKRQRRHSGFWIGTQKGVLWMKHENARLKKLKDDGSPLETLNISPDGTCAAWSTQGGRIFWHTPGQEAVFLDYGRNPVWHPGRKILLYSGSHQTGTVSAGYDLKIATLDGHREWMTQTPYSQENWPIWLPNENMILFTADHTSDLFVQDIGREFASRTVSDAR